MITYRAMFKFLDEGVHGEVLDFPGVITWGADLAEARKMLASALVDMAETCFLKGEPLPLPDPHVSEEESDLEEPIYLLVQAASRVGIAVEDAA